MGEDALLRFLDDVEAVVDHDGQKQDCDGGRDSFAPVMADLRRFRWRAHPMDASGGGSVVGYRRAAPFDDFHSATCSACLRWDDDLCLLPASDAS